MFASHTQGAQADGFKATAFKVHSNGLAERAEEALRQLDDDRWFLRAEIERYRREVADMQGYLRESAILFFLLSFAIALFVGGDELSGKFLILGIRVTGSSVFGGMSFLYLVTFIVGLIASDAPAERRGRLFYSYIISLAFTLISTPIVAHILEKSVRIG